MALRPILWRLPHSSERAKDFRILVYRLLGAVDDSSSARLIVNRLNQTNSINNVWQWSDVVTFKLEDIWLYLYLLAWQFVMLARN